MAIETLPVEGYHWVLCVVLANILLMQWMAIQVQLAMLGKFLLCVAFLFHHKERREVYNVATAQIPAWVSHGYNMSIT